VVWLLGITGGALAADKPNILLILADDLGYGDARCYNPSSRIPTPNIDRLAAQGTRFTDAHSPSAVCSPTRYGLMTGRYAWRGPLKRGVLNGYSPVLLEPGRLTLPAMLQAAGYTTAGLGKWHLGLGNRERTDYSLPLTPGPLEAGFQYFFGIPASLDMVPYVYFENAKVVAEPTATVAESKHQRDGGAGFWRGGAGAPGFMHGEVLPTLTAKAEEFIRGQKGRTPFFLYLALTAPHTPWLPDATARGRSRAGDYGDFVAMTDDALGRVLRALDDAKLARNTLVIFTSDNGAHWLPNEVVKWNHRANGDWRGQKSDVWEAGHRVPFIVRWPGQAKAGATRSGLTGLVDVMGTIAEVIGTRLPDDAAEDSVSFLAALRARKVSRPARATLVVHSGNGVFGFREGNWKYIPHLGSGGFTQPANESRVPGGPAGQLYDLSKDPGERENLWAARPEVVARLATRLDQIKTAGRSR
jgi:arylsulfatase A-like enzyme